VPSLSTIYIPIEQWAEKWIKKYKPLDAKELAKKLSIDIVKYDTPLDKRKLAIMKCDLLLLKISELKKEIAKIVATLEEIEKELYNLKNGIS